MQHTIFVITLIIELMSKDNSGNNRRTIRYSMIDHIPYQIIEMRRLVGRYDSDCIDNLRRDRNTFGRLCLFFKKYRGLTEDKFFSIEEQITMFLCVLSHHTKNWIVKYGFRLSGQTISHYVHLVLSSILQLYSILLVKPTLVPEDNNNLRWKWFKVQKYTFVYATHIYLFIL